MLIVNGLLNTMDQNQIAQVATTVIEIVESTIRGAAFDAACKRLATGLI